MNINLDYCSMPQPDGRILVKPFCYAVDEDGPDGGTSVRDANYARHLVAKFAGGLPGEYSTEPPTPDWHPVFRICLSVTNVRGRDAFYAIGDYQRFDCAAVYNEVCAGYMELYSALKKITRAARKRRDAEKSMKRLRRSRR